jgi:hypothetical protein
MMKQVALDPLTFDLVPIKCALDTSCDSDLVCLELCEECPRLTNLDQVHDDHMFQGPR